MDECTGGGKVASEEEEKEWEPFDMLAAVRRNRERLEQRFAAAAANGQRWLVECRDLGDAFDADAGVYFVECADDAAVDQVVARCTDDNSYDRVLGIYDLRRPLGEQGGGLPRSAWIPGKE
jgi:hypothetical protein